MSTDDLAATTVLDFTTAANRFYLPDQPPEAVHEHHATEPSTQQRPWAAVARYPEPFEPQAAVGHFAAMALAHHLAFAEGIPTAVGDEVRALTYRHFFPMAAAFTAAASMDESRDWTSSLVRDAIADGAGVPETCWEWLTAAGINPDEIAPAS